jgi:ADP-heptose:LPS heptosyltransferase
MSRRKVFAIDGGAGRAIASIPALEKYARNHKDEDWAIVVFGWDILFFGNPLLQDRVYSADVKGIFNNLLKDSDIITPEPYRLWDYYNQKCSLAEGFDKIINETDDHSDLGKPHIYLSKAEEKIAANVLADVKAKQHKDVTIVIQPFGRSARIDNGDIIDDSSRSIEPHNYYALVKKLSQKYNIIFMGEQDYIQQVQEKDTYSFKLGTDLRGWSAIIEAADYFIGCDSVGQHMARAFDKPGTVLVGSTFAINTTYPDFFQIIENEKVEKVYSPIRICGLDSHLADRLNDRCMDFDDEQIETIYKKVVSDIKEKVQK